MQPSRRDRALRSAGGLSLAEVLVCLMVLTTVAAPMFGVFSTSRRLAVTAQELDMATTLASSYLSALESVSPKAFTEFGPTREERLAGPFALAPLGLAPCPKGYGRSVTLLRVRKGPSPVALWHAIVTVEWVGRHSKRLLRHRLGRFLR